MKGQQMAFLLPEQRTPVARSSLNLSPRSVPNIDGAADSRLEQTHLAPRSTSFIGRCSVVLASKVDCSASIAHDAPSAREEAECGTDRLGRPRDVRRDLGQPLPADQRLVA